MTSFITHMGIGIIFAEILLRVIDDDSEFRKDNRPLLWFLGALGGLSPDLDAIPTFFTGEHIYTYHHYFTHTFLAVGVLLVLIIVLKFNPLMIAYALGFVGHLATDFVDNSISPLGPFDMILLGKYIEWGMLCGWQEMPCMSGACGWASEFWLDPTYKYHDLWSIFLHNGWGIQYQLGSTTEFMSYYDLTIFIISIPLILATLLMVIKKGIKR